MSFAKPSHAGWPRVAPALFYDDAAAAIDWLARAFDFKLRLRIDGDDGRVVHSELECGDGLVMVANARNPAHPELTHTRSPRSLAGANTQSLCVVVDDPDAHCARARAAGAVIASAPETQDYGPEYGAHRGYRAIDLEGHHWWFLREVRGPAATPRAAAATSAAAIRSPPP